MEKTQTCACWNRLCSDLFWTCKVIEGKEEEMVYVLYFTVAFTVVGQRREKNPQCKSLGILPKASTTENISSV